MHGNVVSAVSQLLTPDLIAKISSLAGISDRATTQKVVGAALPAILFSLATLASKPGGERRLADAIAKQSPRTLENLASTIGAQRSSRMQARACCRLCSAAAPSAPLRAASAGSQVSATGRPAPSSACSLPSSSACSDAKQDPEPNGLTQLLAAQKDNFEAAMPAGLSDLLRIGGDRIGTVTSAASRGSEAGPPAGSFRPPRPRREAVTIRPSSNWVYWALPFLALAGLAWYFLSGERTSGPVAEFAVAGKASIDCATGDRRSANANHLGHRTRSTARFGQ